jgi:hypothetical protein
LYDRALAATEVAGDYSASNDLRGYWNFNEAAGLVANDASGNNFTATVSGPTWTLGKSSSALAFNNATNAVVTPIIPLGNTFSVSAWVNTAVAKQTGYARIAETRYSTGFFLGVDATGTKYKFIVNNGSGSGCAVSFGCAEGGAVTAGWHLVTGTFDGTTAKLYVNNALVATDRVTAPASASYPLYIGRYYGYAAYAWTGSIDEVRLYNRAVTAAEVSAIFTY